MPLTAPAKPPAAPATLLEELETRQEEVLRELDELNERIEQAVAEYARSLKPGVLPLRALITALQPSGSATGAAPVPSNI